MRCCRAGLGFPDCAPEFLGLFEVGEGLLDPTAVLGFLRVDELFDFFFIVNKG